MKKISIILLVTIFAFSSFLATKSNPVSAAETPSNVEYHYYYKGINFTSIDSPLSDEQLESLYQMTVKPESDSRVFSPMIPVDPDPYPSIRTTDVYNVTYTNIETKLAISLFGTLILSKLPKVNSTISSWLAGTLLGVYVIDKIPVTYLGCWNYKSYDNAANKYRLYATTVRYKTAYNTPIDVVTYPLGWE